MNTIDLNDETVTIEELSKAWGYYKRVKDVQDTHQKIQELYKQMFETPPILFTPLTEPDPQG